MTESKHELAGPTYSSYTYDSPNALKRKLHRNRYKNILRNLRIDTTSRVLDFGSGDGRLFRVMIDDYGADPSKLVAFDPVTAMRDEFGRLVPEARFVSDSREITTPPAGEEFHYIFCCEVFEHLTASEIESSLAEFRRLAGPDTTFIIEVPIEIGPVGLLKNLYRRFLGNYPFEISFAVMFKALLGIEQNRTPRLTPSGQETFEHPGYSFRTTRRLLSRIITLSAERNDPFRFLPFVLNNSRIMVGKLRS